MCSNSWVDVTSETYDWASTNSGIVNVASAVSHFMSPGSVTGSGQVQLQRQLARLDCPVQGFEPQNTQNAQPTVAIQVQSGFVSMAGNGLVLLAGSGGLGTTAITAVGSPSGGSYSWTAGPNLSISGVSSANASVGGTAPSRSAGDTYVSNSYTLDSQTGQASVRFTILNPTTLTAANYPGGASATTPYSSGNLSGYITSITYYIYDQMSPAGIIQLPGIPLTEVLTTTSNPYGASFEPPDNTPRTAESNSAGQLQDLLYAYDVGGLPVGFSASRSQNLTANGFGFIPAQQQTYTRTYATISIQSLSR
ncbi:MAG: hypothetical protein JOZ32_05345 [Bryobacterales bacterium]|nr:hypothetical protein [Bryobacterales bacterium]